MAATVRGLSGVVFGVDTVSAVVMQDYDSELTSVVTEVVDEDNDVVAFAISHANRADISGNYIFKGDDIGAIGDELTLANAVGGGDVAIVSFGRKLTKDGFLTGSFKAIRVEGVTWS